MPQSRKAGQSGNSVLPYRVIFLYSLFYDVHQQSAELLPMFQMNTQSYFDEDDPIGWCQWYQSVSNRVKRELMFCKLNIFLILTLRTILHHWGMSRIVSRINQFSFDSKSRSKPCCIVNSLQHALAVLFEVSCWLYNHSQLSFVSRSNRHLEGGW